MKDQCIFLPIQLLFHKPQRLRVSVFLYTGPTHLLPYLFIDILSSLLLLRMEVFLPLHSLTGYR